MKAEFHKRLHIACIGSETDWHELKVNTLLQDTNTKQPSINAFLGARYSRSADPVIDIADEVYSSGKDAAKRLEAIFYNYGHKSVGDMADIFLCLENIPILMAQRFFYTTPVHAGQERSTRYQDFSKPKFVKFPRSMKVSKKIRESYESLFHEALSNYSSLRLKTEKEFIAYYGEPKDAGARSALQARVFDTIRYFIPIGLQTSIGVVCSARTWAEKISYYRASKFSIERELGELIYDLLMGNCGLKELGYIPEADGLIRHTEADNSRNESTEEIKKLLKGKFKIFNKLRIGVNKDPSNEMLINYYLLKDPDIDINFTKRNIELEKKISSIIFKYHDHHHQLGNIAQSGAYLIEGVTDYGVLKDLIRHRSFEKFIPLFEEQMDIEKLMEKEPEDMYRLCDYLEYDEFKDLRMEYTKKMTEYYSKVKDWYQLSKSELDSDLINEYTRYLFTHSLKLRYKVYGSFDDIAYTIALRTRNGGHIAYRRLTREWLRLLALRYPLWQGLDKKLPKVDIGSKDQFYDRS